MKEELRKEFLDYMNSYGNDTIEQSDNREFNWWSSKLEAQSKTHDYNYSYLKELHTNQAVIISDYQTKLEAKDKEIAELKGKVDFWVDSWNKADREIAYLKAKLEAAEKELKK